MSAEKQAKNRGALRSIDSLENALLELLDEKPYQKITITEIAERSGRTRATFYAHYETKDALLESIINNVIDQFFREVFARDMMNPDPEKDPEMNKNFFRIWKQNKKLIPLLTSVGFENLMITRMKAFWAKHSSDMIIPNHPEWSEQLSGYITTMLSYGFVGFLKEWFSQDMEPSPEVMGELMDHFIGPKVCDLAHQNFKDRFKN